MGYGAIICPIDGSERDQKSEEIAAYLSKTSGARLILLHVMGKWRDASLLVTNSAQWQNIHSSWLNEGKELLEKEAGRLREKGVRFIKTELRDGELASEILTVAGEQNADLIVMASERPSPALKFFKDRISDIIFDNAPCPVLWVYK